MMTSAALERVRVVLCQTTHPGNIGAAARAIKTMGLSRLVLVRPRFFPHPDSTAFAAGADDVLDRAVVCDSLEEALAGTRLAVAATGRHRDLTLESVSCREACGRLLPDAMQGEVALVFGTERSGLTTREIGCCQLIATIPASPDYGSLNLAQAVQVFAYELRIAALAMAPAQPAEAGKRDELATNDELEGFYRQLEAAFYETGFLDPRQPRRLMQRMRRLFARARAEKTEVNILRGFLSAVLGPRGKDRQ